MASAIALQDQSCLLLGPSKDMDAQTGGEKTALWNVLSPLVDKTVIYDNSVLFVILILDNVHMRIC